MNQLHDKKCPNESSAYRKHRITLLAEEIKLRKKLEEVAALRRKLPQGGRVKEEYIFDEISNGSKVVHTKFSELFEKGKNTLIIYNFMYPDGSGKPCPVCTSILDGLNGSAVHVYDKVSFAVVAKEPIAALAAWGKKRGWTNLRLLSSAHNTFNRDYFAEDEDGNQHPLLHVFQKTPTGIFHFYTTELYFAPVEKDQDPRHVDLIWPIWQMFDYTPEGRGKWFPKYSYKK